MMSSLPPDTPHGGSSASKRLQTMHDSSAAGRENSIRSVISELDPRLRLIPDAGDRHIVQRHEGDGERVTVHLSAELEVDRLHLCLYLGQPGQNGRVRRGAAVVGAHRAGGLLVRLRLGVGVDVPPLALGQLAVGVQGGKAARYADLLIGQHVVSFLGRLADVHDTKCHVFYSPPLSAVVFSFLPSSMTYSARIAVVGTLPAHRRIAPVTVSHVRLMPQALAAASLARARHTCGISFDVTPSTGIS